MMNSRETIAGWLERLAGGIDEGGSRSRAERLLSAYAVAAWQVGVPNELVDRIWQAAGGEEAYGAADAAELREIAKALREKESSPTSE